MIRGSTVPIRFHNLMKHIPDFLGYKTCLYVGANKARLQLIPELAWAGYTIDVLEIFPPYLRELATLNQERHYFRRLQFGDVRTHCFGEYRWDIVVWWHGPEHVEQAEVTPVLHRLSAVATILAVAAAQHGHYPQGVTRDGNQAQRHRWDVTPELFRAAGWECDTLLPTPGSASHLIAWKRTGATHVRQDQ